MIKKFSVLSAIESVLKSLNKTRQEAIEDLEYFIKMPFVAQSEEHTYFHAIKPQYLKNTGLHANNTKDAFVWFLKELKR